MNTFEIEFLDIAVGLLISSIGLIAIVISLFRLKSRDFSLLTFGLNSFVYGVRWLEQTSTMTTLVGFPFTYPLLDNFLVYAVVLSLSAFLLAIFGRGFYNSMLWVFLSIIIYTIVAIGYDLLRPGPLPGPAINPVVLVLWCFVWVANFLFVRRQPQIEFLVLRTVFSIALACVVQDQLVNMDIVPWRTHFEHAGFLVFYIGMAFVVAHRFFLNERKLLAFEQEIEIARRIQQSNLPSDLRSPEGIDIAARYVPMSTVAGDFYDIHIKDETGVGILIADVSGHGVGAALVGSMLKIAFASQAEHLSDPARVLMEINRILQGNIENSFVTACSLFVDIRNGKIWYSNAGHPPPVLWRKSTKEIHRLSIGGTILGPFPNAVYENAGLNLAKDDRLVLYSDGIIETRNRTGEIFGENRLDAFIDEHSTESVDRTADEFLEHLLRWSGKSHEASYDDDLTLIIVDVVSEPEDRILGVSRKEVGVT
jgi:hypothetical protein